MLRQKSGGGEERNQLQERGGTARGGDGGQNIRCYVIRSSKRTHTHTEDSCFWWSSHSTEVGAALKTACRPRACKSRPHHLTLWKPARWRQCSLTGPPAGPFEGPSQEPPTRSAGLFCAFLWAFFSTDEQVFFVFFKSFFHFFRVVANTLGLWPRPSPPHPPPPPHQEYQADGGGISMSMWTCQIHGVSVPPGRGGEEEGGGGSTGTKET